jgi:2,3-bisphosphoglycerate-independent phosphoglycerate mutase
MNKKPVLLIILDGYGVAPKTKYNAIAQANTPHLDTWFAHYPHATLQASGAAVGLPAGSIGNSEVGHLTIGAGRIIEQPESFILRAIASGSFYKNPVLQTHLQELKKKNKALHVIGLLSDAGVHCTEEIIFAFIQAATGAGIEKIFVHPILDGRDVAPKSAALYLQRLDEFLRTVPQARIGSLHGRFYAMDRDNNWDRTKQSYEILTLSLNQLGTNGKEIQNLTNTIKDQVLQSDMISIPHSVRPESIEGPLNWPSILEANYAAGIADEFIPPTNLDPEAIVSNGDGIIFANYRPDRARQLTEYFIPLRLSTPSGLADSAGHASPTFSHFERKDIDLEFFITPVSYGLQINTSIMYPHKPVTNTLKEILSHAGKTIFSIAETEKYAHITYFFDGGREAQFPRETRVLIPSLHTRNYIANPEMSAPAITQAVLKSLQENPCDFYLINYANADMVGHSGDFEATKKAIEVLDAQLGQLFKVVVEEMHGTMFITGDHGNAEDKFDEASKQPHTAHTTNPVPFLMLSESNKNGAVELPLNQLSDIAGFVLKFMGLNTQNTHNPSADA